MKMCEFRVKSHWNLFTSVQLTPIHYWISDNILASTRRQTIIWTNDGIVYWRIYALLDPNEVTEPDEHIDAQRVCTCLNLHCCTLTRRYGSVCSWLKPIACIIFSMHLVEGVQYVITTTSCISSLFSTDTACQYNLSNYQMFEENIRTELSVSQISNFAWKLTKIFRGVV